MVKVMKKYIEASELERIVSELSITTLRGYISTEELIHNISINTVSTPPPSNIFKVNCLDDILEKLDEIIESMDSFKGDWGLYIADLEQQNIASRPTLRKWVKAMKDDKINPYINFRNAIDVRKLRWFLSWQRNS